MTTWRESPPDDPPCVEPDDEDTQDATEKLVCARRVNCCIGERFVAQDEDFFSKLYEESETLRTAFAAAYADDIASLAGEYALERLIDEHDDAVAAAQEDSHDD